MILKGEGSVPLLGDWTRLAGMYQSKYCHKRLGRVQALQFDREKTFVFKD